MAYWYVPKGLSVSAESILPRLKILKEFEHNGTWRDCQSGYIERLNAEGVSHAESDWPEGGAPLARMLKQVLTLLGLVWVDESESIDFTPAGNSLLDAGDHDAALAKQVLRYQIWNPTIRARHHQAIRLHPVPFLIRLLQSLGTSISPMEYRLFVARAKRIEDIDAVADLIEEFRGIDEAEQRLLADRCDAYMLGGERRSSIYNTIKLNQSYAVAMWRLSNIIGVDDDHSIHLVAGALRGENRRFIEQYAGQGEYIAFANKKEFVAWMGDPDALPLRETALDLYRSRGDLEAATAVQKKMGLKGKALNEFRRVMASEKRLEDDLEANFEIIGKQLGVKVEFVGRQYETTVGPIDILLKEVGGTYIVVELKKGRSADKVFGQLSRYMGWVKRNLADNKPVRGVVVAAEIDDKLVHARDAHDTDVSLIEYRAGMTLKTI
ncbi:endonuclease NucS [Novosphingobium sp. ZN18A2]|uniref:endonuclease NucS domain-containing protein n=1 Tax=Novosphingobium sp. ZN18A2 TaxID=3079861 RepID=UPI0030CE9D68